MTNPLEPIRRQPDGSIDFDRYRADIHVLRHQTMQDASKLGAAMKFEVGASETQLKEVYAREPFDFDDQHIDKLDLMIPAGNVTRVTCTFDNIRDQKVGYGESTLDEMCYFVGFAVGGRGGACIEVLPPNIFGN